MMKQFIVIISKYRMRISRSNKYIYHYLIILLTKKMANQVKESHSLNVSINLDWVQAMITISKILANNYIKLLNIIISIDLQSYRSIRLSPNRHSLLLLWIFLGGLWQLNYLQLIYRILTLLYLVIMTSDSTIYKPQDVLKKKQEEQEMPI